MRAGIPVGTVVISPTGEIRIYAEGGCGRAPGSTRWIDCCPMARKEILPKNVSCFVDRHGKAKHYRWRLSGRSAYFKAHPNTPEGRAELADFIAQRQTETAPRYAHGTVGWVATAIWRRRPFLQQEPGDGQHRTPDPRKVHRRICPRPDRQFPLRPYRGDLCSGPPPSA
jgi:hypothetical protein